MYNTRLNTLRRKMGEQNIDQLLLSYPSNMYYLTGQWLSSGRRIIALIITQTDAKLVVNKLVPVQPMEHVETIFYGDWDSWTQSVAVHIRETGTVGVDMEWPAGFLFSMMELKPKARFIDGSGPINSMRMIKDEHEIALMRASSHANDECMKGLIEAISPELTELELSHHLFELAEKTGTDGFKGVAGLAYGVNIVDAHHTAGSTRLKPGDSIVMDIGFGYQRYRADMTRTVFYKEPSAVMKKAYQAVYESQKTAMAAVRPGVTFDTLDRIAREIVEDHGFDEYFTHRTGHCIGLDVHEPPYVVIGNHMEVQPGMIFSIEPGIYIPGEGGVRIEDLVLVTEDGNEPLNRYPSEMQILFE